MSDLAQYYPTVGVCDGCLDEKVPVADLATLWLKAPLGLTAVHTHRVRECAEAARGARGGGRFVVPDAP